MTDVPATSPLDVQAIRQDFPVLHQEVHGRPLVYLDNAASSQKPRVVIEALDEYYRRYNANVHRGIHTLSEQASAAYEEARRKVARFINARSAKEVIWTRNTTESINLVAYSWGRANIGPGDEILLTEMEHHSNLIPWQILAQEKGATLRFIPVTDDGYLDLDCLDDLLTERTKLVSVVHMSNVLGTINPVAEIGRRAHEVGAKILVDGAQSVPHLPVDVQALDCDFLAFSGHKMCGPTGIGVLYGKRDLLEAMPPFMGGGDMIREVYLDSATWNDLPWKFEAGTPAIAQAIGLGYAVDYLNSIGMEAIQQHEHGIIQYALEALSRVKGLTLYGPPADMRGGVATFNIPGVHPHDVSTILDSEGIAIRAGHHCAQPLMRRYNVPATARASFYLYNTPDEVDILIQGLEKAKAVFGI
ncbi:MAG: cysteine desulfurase [Chloroflexi bacterium]|nr:MAG: cysteine desulfurase [Chloroflexota bacterium]